MKCFSNDNIPLYTESSPDWTKTGHASPPFAVGMEVGVNQYTFGRTTPDNQFIVATGLNRNPHGIEMIGGKKKSSVKKDDKKKVTKKKDDKKKVDKKKDDKKKVSEKKVSKKKS